jgi:hypothetical protein
LVEVVDNISIINLRNSITVSEVPLDVVAEGLVGLLDEAGQIPSGFGTQVGCLVVLDEGAVEILSAVDGADWERFEPVEGVMTHHDREVGGHDVIVVARGPDGNGVGAQPRLGVRLTVVLLDLGWLEGSGPLDGPEPVGEGGEAVKVVVGLVVATWSLRRVVAPAAAVLVVGVGDAVFLIIPATSLALSSVALTMTVVDAWAQIFLVELEAKVVLVDLLFVIIVGSCRVVTRLGTVGRIVLVQPLGLRGSHMQMSASLDNLGGLLDALKHLEHRGEVGRWRGENFLAVVVEDEVGVEVA